ncbi:HI1506-related protein [Solidesulfovibrio sp.]
MAKVYRITSKKAGFRRAGLSHPATAVDHPADSLTADQLMILATEPMLVVQELDLPDDGPPLELDEGGGTPPPPEPGDGGDGEDGKGKGQGKAKAEGK